MAGGSQVTRAGVWLALLLCLLSAWSVHGQTDAECAAHARKGHVPDAFVSALYLNEWNGPAPFIGIPCAAAQSGAVFRYKRAGWFGKDSFSIKGKDSVQVWIKPITQGNGTTVVLVPVEYEKNGQVFSVTRTNIQELAFYIRQAVANE